MSDNELVGGTLYVVATPLGNLQDLTPRMAHVLAEVDVLYVEDTRRTGTLLNHLGTPRHTESLHSHNEQQRVQRVLDHLSEGRTVAIASDAGTPGLSDPGAEVVAAAHDARHPVSPVVGPSALAAAISVAGFHEGSRDVWFVGFLPTKGKPRRELLERVAKYPGSVVLYEGPHRAESLLVDLAQAQPDRAACVCRELTKMHEEVRRDVLAELVPWARDGVKGELTLMLGPVEQETHTADDSEIDAALAKCLDAGLTARDASTAVAVLLERPRREVYNRCQTLAQR